MPPPQQRRPSTSLWSWAGLLVAALLTAAVGVVVDWVVLFAQSSTCYDAPSPDRVRHGQLALLGVLGVSAAPWALATWMARRKVPVLACGMLAVTPAFVIFLDGLRSAAWVGGFCF
jgi:hypothetical protein